MNQLLKFMIMTLISISSTQLVFASNATKPLNPRTAQLQDETPKLQGVWKSYKASVEAMNTALPKIKQEKDINKKNASISVHNQRLEQTKNVLNQLVLTQSTANQLRRQMIEHATKYQGVYRLAAIDNLSTNQLNMFHRLDDQTTSLYKQMLDTASMIIE